MIRMLIREDPALRYIHKWVLMSIVTATFVLNIVTFMLHDSAGGGASEVTGQPMKLWYTIMVWFILALYLAAGQTRTRCSVFGMSLPVSSRRLWGAHMAAVGIGGLALLIAGLLAAAIGSLLLLRLTESEVFASLQVFVASLHLASLYALVVLVLDMRSTSLRSVPQTARGRLATIALALAMLALTLAMLSLPPWVFLVPLVAAVVLGARRLQALPESFSLAPDRAESAVATREALDGWQAAPRSGTSNWWLVTMVTYRSIYRKKFAPFIIVPFVLLFGALLAGLDQVWLDENIRPLSLIMCAYVLMAFIIDPMVHLHRVEAFPISRRRVFGLLILPSLIILAVGYAAGQIWLERSAKVASREAICFCEASEGYYYTRVPGAFCEIAWQGNTPENETPSGESHAAWSIPLHPGSPIKLYSPFSVGEGASVDFAAHQISRAVEAIFREAITPEEIARRYLRERSDGSAALAVDVMTIQRDYPHLKPRHVGPVFPVLLMLVSVLWLVSVRVFLPVLRAGNSRKKRMTVGFVIMAVLLALYLLQIVAGMSGAMPIWVSIGLVEILVRKMGDAFPGSTALVWVASLAVIAAVYLWVQRRFERVECVGTGDDDSCFPL